MTMSREPERIRDFELGNERYGPGGAMDWKTDGCNYVSDIYREDAILIIEHLQKVFGLNKNK